MAIKEIPIKDIILPDVNVRDTVEDGSLDELMKSIKSVGLLQPIRVRSKNGKFVLITGLRRLKAFEKLGRKKIRAEIDEGEEVSDLVKGLPIERQDQIKMIIENYQRVKGDDMKEADIVTNLYDLFYKMNGSPTIRNGEFHKDSINAVGEVIGVSDSWVRSRLNIQKLTKGAKLLREQMESEGLKIDDTGERRKTRIPIRVASEIGSKIKDEEKQIAVMDAVAGLPTDKALKVLESVIEKDMDPYEVAEAIKEKDQPRTKLIVINLPTEILDYYFELADKEGIDVEDYLIKVLTTWRERGETL